MLRRWMRAYSAWDERTYERFHERLRMRPSFRVLLVCLFCVNTLFLPVWIWRLRPDFNLWLGFTLAVAICVAFAVAMRRNWRKELRRARQRAGCCLACGYDLRAHLKADRCPECGTVAGAGSQSS